MTEIQKSKQGLGLKGLVIEYWNFKFICNLVLGICDFRHKTPRQSQTSLTPAMRDRLGPEDQVFQGIINRGLIINYSPK